MTAAAQTAGRAWDALVEEEATLAERQDDFERRREQCLANYRALADGQRGGWTPIASRGELSPVSTTSVTWETKRWPIKPELVLEGGNTARDPSGTQADSPESLSLLTTRRVMRGLFGATGDTSAGGAAGARLAALVMCRYPGTWPETVRAVLVVSIRAPEVEVDLYTPVAALVAASVPVEIET